MDNSGVEEIGKYNKRESFTRFFGPKGKVILIKKGNKPTIHHRRINSLQHIPRNLHDTFTSIRYIRTKRQTRKRAASPPRGRIWQFWRNLLSHTTAGKWRWKGVASSEIIDLGGFSTGSFCLKSWLVLLEIEVIWARGYADEFCGYKWVYELGEDDDDELEECDGVDNLYGRYCWRRCPTINAKIKRNGRNVFSLHTRHLRYARSWYP